MWLNCRRKSTEGCSAYSPILAVLGGVFSVLQMFLLSYNYGTVLISSSVRVNKRVKLNVNVHVKVLILGVAVEAD